MAAQGPPHLMLTTSMRELRAQQRPRSALMEFQSEDALDFPNAARRHWRGVAWLLAGRGLVVSSDSARDVESVVDRVVDGLGNSVA